MDHQPLRTEYLMTYEAELGQILSVGSRIAAHAVGGWFDGPKLNGRVLPGSGDWPVVRPDGTLDLDLRVVLETNDGALIYMSGVGRQCLPEEARNLGRAERAQLDPASYYFRTTYTFETGAENYAWLNNIVAVGVGRITETGPVISIFDVL